MPGIRAVQDDQARCAELDGVLDCSIGCDGRSEVTLKSSAVIVIACNDVQRQRQRADQVSRHAVFVIARVIGQVARQQHCVRLSGHAADCLEHGRQAHRRIAVSPGGTDVRIADLGEDEGR
jgi:hypothetical protein